MRQYLSAVSFLFIFLFSIAAIAQPPLKDKWWVPDGPVNAMLQKDGALYIGGEFRYIGVNHPCGIAANTATGALDFSFAKPNGQVTCCVADGNGGWYIGGDFTEVNGKPRKRLARLNANGSLHSWNPGANNIVYTLTLSGNTIYVGGRFDTIGTQLRNRVAAISTTTGVASSWNPNVEPSGGGSVTSIAVGQNTVYIAGGFWTIGGMMRRSLAAVDIATGTVTSWNPGADAGGVQCIALAGNTLYAGGYFYNAGGAQRKGLAAISTVTSKATAWDPNPSANAIQDIKVNGNTIYVCGAFSSIGGQARANIAAIDAATGLATNWNPMADDHVFAMELSGNSIFASGRFASIGGQKRPYIACLDAKTGMATSWSASVNHWVSAMAINAGTIYLGGSFSSAGGVWRSCLAAIDTATGKPTAWDPNVSTPNGMSSGISALVQNGNTIYVGGNFSFVGGKPRYNLAAVDATTGIPTAWDPTPHDVVQALALHKNRVYVTGNFRNIGGLERWFIAAVDTGTGLADTGWNAMAGPPTGMGIPGITATGNTLYVAGSSFVAGGSIIRNLAALDANTGTASTWDPKADFWVSTLTVHNSMLYAGGSFATMGGQPRNGLAAIDLATGSMTSWQPSTTPSDIRSIVVSGNSVYVGGKFSNMGGQARNNFAVIDAATGMASDWDPAPETYYANDIAVNAIVVSGSTVYLGGWFHKTSGVGHPYLAAYSYYGETATEPAPVKIYPMPAGNELTLEIVDETLLQTIAAITDIQGRTVRQFTITESVLQVSVGDIAPGIYLLRTKTGAYKFVKL